MLRDGRELARALARARLTLRLGIQTHKRSINAHRRAQKELVESLGELEKECEALGVSLVLQDDERRRR